MPGVDGLFEWERAGHTVKVVALQEHRVAALLQQDLNDALVAALLCNTFDEIGGQAGLTLLDLAVRFGPFKDTPLAPCVPEDNVDSRRVRAGVVEESVVLSKFHVSEDLEVDVDEANSLHARAIIWRKHHYIEVNVLRLNGMLQLMGFAPYVFPPGLAYLSNRLSMAVGVLFSIVGLRFLVDNQLPKLDFLTVTRSVVGPVHALKLTCAKRPLITFRLESFGV